MTTTQDVQQREQRAGFHPPASGTPTHSRKSAPVDISRLDRRAQREQDCRCAYCHQQHPPIAPWTDDDSWPTWLDRIHAAYGRYDVKG